jgi:hypothetical protein
MFTHGQDWVDRGTKEFESKRTQRELSSLQRKAANLGYQIIPQPASA